MPHPSLSSIPVPFSLPSVLLLPHPSFPQLHPCPIRPSLISSLSAILPFISSASFIFLSLSSIPVPSSLLQLHYCPILPFLSSFSALFFLPSAQSHTQSSPPSAPSFSQLHPCPILSSLSSLLQSAPSLPNSFLPQLHPSISFIPVQFFPPSASSFNQLHPCPILSSFVTVLVSSILSSLSSIPTLPSSHPIQLFPCPLS